MAQKTIIIYYKYTAIPRPRDAMIQQRSVCAELGLKGRILVASEGINGTLEGNNSDIAAYCRYMDSHAWFSGINFKKSPGNGNAFPKLVVRARKEIVTGALEAADINPNEITGKYLTADELHDWLLNNKDFKIIDMRNDYEQAVGQFEGSILPGMSNFKDLRKAVQKLEHLKKEKIVTVCTAGVRCEKASGYLLTQGFKEVYQLKDGIVTYMEKYPNQHFKGKLYVFDNRILMGFETDSPEHQVIGRCGICGSLSEAYENCANNDCHKHFICCSDCRVNGLPFCSNKCQLIFEKDAQKQGYKVAI
jgi:UPF0176 protein